MHQFRPGIPEPAAKEASAWQGIRVSSILSDAEQQFSYFLVRRCGALAFYAGPETLLPEGTVRLPIENFPLLWSCYMYERSEGIPPIAQRLKEAIIAFRNDHQRQVARADYPHRRPLSPSGQGRGCAPKGGRFGKGGVLRPRPRRGPRQMRTARGPLKPALLGTSTP